MSLEAHLKSIEDSNKNQQQIYESIVNDMKKDNIALDDYWSKWYNTGGYQYNTSSFKYELKNLPLLKEYRGTCLDIGSGDGFWSFCLSYYYNVTGIDPIKSSIYLSNKYKSFISTFVNNNTNFIVGDALKDIPDTQYDVIFCRAPNFFNYPMITEYNENLKDKNNERLYEYWNRTQNKKTAKELIERNETRSYFDSVEQFKDCAGKAGQYLEYILKHTKKYFVFILSTKKEYYGKYLGSTYCHDPDDVYKLFSKYGKCNVKVVDDSYLYAEIIL